jgi:hypothetical protein
MKKMEVLYYELLKRNLVLWFITPLLFELYTIEKLLNDSTLSWIETQQGEYGLQYLK